MNVSTYKYKYEQYNTYKFGLFFLLSNLVYTQETIYNYFGNGYSDWDYNWGLGCATSKTWTMWCMNEEPSLTCPHNIRREGEDWSSISDKTASAFRVDISTGVSVPSKREKHVALS
jgi:hypothetical protein